MARRLALTLAALGGLLAAGPVLAQNAISSAPVGGTSGSYSSRGYSRGQAPNSDFNSQGSAMTRSEMIRQRSAAATGRPAPVTPPRRAARSRNAAR